MASRPNPRGKSKPKTSSPATRPSPRSPRGKVTPVAAPVRTVSQAPVPLRAVEGGRTRETTRPLDSRGKYVYCVIKSEEPLKFGPIGIGGEPADVHTINY